MEYWKLHFHEVTTPRQAPVHACGCWCSDPPSVSCNPLRPVTLADGAACAARSPKEHSVAKPSQSYPSCYRRCCSHAQPWCNVLSITLALGFSKVYYLEQLYLHSRGVWKAPAQVSEVYRVKNHVHLWLKCHCTNKLLAKLGWSIGRWSAVVGLWDSIFCACGLRAVFSLWCCLGAVLSMLHTCSGWGGCYLCHSSSLAVLVSESQPCAVQFTKSDVWSLQYSSQSTSWGSEITA